MRKNVYKTKKDEKPSGKRRRIECGAEEENGVEQIKRAKIRMRDSERR